MTPEPVSYGAVPTAVVLAHLVATLLMGGVILYVQVVHYPLMSRVGRADFPAYESGHTTRTGLVVAPLMLVEAASAVWLAAVPPGGAAGPVAWAGLGLLAVIWASTALLQVPGHRRLSRGFDETVHRALVRGNLIRTVAWLLRIPVALALTIEALAPPG